MDTLRLSELTELIQNTIDSKFIDFYNITAEINQLSINRSGHAYLQLIEKEEGGNVIIANMRAMIWANKLNLIQAHFESVTQTQLQSDIKILARVEVRFHQQYGLSLLIHNIDPTYTLGDLEQQRQKIIKQLQADGIFDMNKSLSLPLVPQDIAIISSATAAGFGDFINQLNNNKFNYKFNYKLFEATMQGEKTDRSIVNALDNIYSEIDKFSLVVIIRGGGSKLDLSAFDSYLIASNIAQFPLPILTGIGHQRDISITDMVAHKNLKTPTATADFIIQKVYDFENSLNSKIEYLSMEINRTVEKEKLIIEKRQSYITNNSLNLINNNRLHISKIEQNIIHTVKNTISGQNQKLAQLFFDLKSRTDRLLHKKNVDIEKKKIKLLNKKSTFIKTENNKLDKIELLLDYHQPQHILNLGYSFTSLNGKIIKSADELNDNDIVTTQLKNGVFSSKVIKKQ